MVRSRKVKLSGGKAKYSKFGQYKRVLSSNKHNTGGVKRLNYLKDHHLPRN